MKSLRAKIATTFILVIGVVLFLLSYYLISEFERYSYEQVLSQLQSESGVVYSYLRSEDRASVERARVTGTLRSIAASTKLRITLIQGDGTVLFESSLHDSLLSSMDNHSRRPEVLQAEELGLGSNLRSSATLGVPMVYLARAVDEVDLASSVFAGTRIIRIGMPATAFQRRVADYRWRIIGSAIVVFVAVLLISRFVARRITRPLLEIVEGIQAITEGDLDRRLVVNSSDELGLVAQHVNELTSKLKTDIEELKKLGRFRSEFLGNVSHELRTPIFSLKGFLETLLEGAVDDKEVNRSFVKRAYDHAGRLDALLKDLIEISRIESGDMRMSFRYFEVGVFLKQLAEDFRFEAETRKQLLRVNTPDHEVSGYGDKERLHQAVGCIVENAIKYSQEGATITLSATEVDGSIKISVEDDGPGIPAEHLPRIFERFYRVDKDRSREIGGTGLGLAIAKHIVEAHKSHIYVTSESGSGSVFEFDIRG